MSLPTDGQLVLAVIWFFIGFGAGYAVTRFWKILLVVLILALLTPFIFNLLGLSGAITTSNIIDAFIAGLNMFANIIASNQYSFIGFFVGLVIGLLAFALAKK